MEKLAERYEKLERVSKACRRAIMLYLNPREDITDNEKEAHAASVIKHYELCYEVLIQYLKQLLVEKDGDDIRGSKTILRACFTRRMIEEDDLLVLLDFVDRRNATVHMYDEDEAAFACQEIIKDFGVFEGLVERLKNW